MKSHALELAFALVSSHNQAIFTQPISNFQSVTNEDEHMA